MNVSAIHRGESASGTAAPGRRPGLPAARRVIPLAGAAGLIMLVSACASMAPRQASVSGTGLRRAAAPATTASRPAPTTSASRLALATSQSTPAATGTTSPPGSVPAAYTGPHFATPQAAMTYMATAYNNDDTTAMRAVTDPEAFNSLQAMRFADTDLRLTSCKQTPRGDYMCSFRYDYVDGHHPRSQTAMVITGPAVNPGWYMYRFIYGCD